MFEFCSNPENLSGFSWLSCYLTTPKHMNLFYSVGTVLLLLLLTAPTALLFGFGGAVMALTEDAFSPDYAESVASAYRGRFGQPPEVIQCRLSDGVRVVERIESTDTIEPALG